MRIVFVLEVDELWRAALTCVPHFTLGHGVALVPCPPPLSRTHPWDCQAAAMLGSPLYPRSYPPPAPVHAPLCLDFPPPVSLPDQLLLILWD